MGRCIRCKRKIHETKVEHPEHSEVHFLSTCPRCMIEYTLICRAIKEIYSKKQPSQI